MADIILINPPYTLIDGLSTKVYKKRNFLFNLPHLGLGYLASAAEKRGYNTKILDCSANSSDTQGAFEIIEAEKPSIIGISITTLTLKASFSFINFLKKKGINKNKIIIGGPHVTMDPRVVEKMDLNFGIMGEAEESFIQFLDFYFEGKSKIHSIAGLIYRENGGLQINKIQLKNDIDTLPFPARHLFKDNNYFYPLLPGNPTSLITSRGCPFNCSFCSSSSLRRKYRERSIENVMAEIREIVDKFNMNVIEFVDDIFTFNYDRTLKLCEEILKNNIKIFWGCQTRADFIDRNLLELMYKAGCRKITFGLEAGSEPVRKKIGKKFSDNVIEDAIKMCRDIGIYTLVNVILGHPWESKKDIIKSIKFIIRLNPDFAIFNPLLVLPDSPLYDLAIKEGRIDSETYYNYMKGISFFPIYEHKNITRKFLLRMCGVGYLLFYLNPLKLFNILRGVKSISTLKNKMTAGLILFRDFVFKFITS